LPEVSVVIPTRNRARLVSRSVRSALAQRDVDLEVVVVDDASDDDTQVALAGVYDSRITVLRNESRRGVSATRNRGIDAAGGRWVAFLDDDDLWSPNKLSEQLGAASKAGAAWAYTGFVQVDERLRVLAGQPPLPPEQVQRCLLARNVLAAGASVVLAERELLRRLGGFDTSLSTLEDWDLWIRLALSGPPAAVLEPLAAYVEHPGMSTLMVDSVLRAAHQIDERYQGSRDQRSIDFRSLYRWMGWCSVRADRRLNAVSVYLRAALGGDLSSFVRAGLALTSPSVARKVARRHLDPAWASRASLWLEAAASLDGQRLDI
jgi:glycosyltransferase involved in cell wall biosynthesis